MTRTREADDGNVGRSVSSAPEGQVEAHARRRLRQALIAGCVENAEEDLAICREWASVDAETAARVPD